MVSSCQQLSADAKRTAASCNCVAQIHHLSFALPVLPLPTHDMGPRGKTGRRYPPMCLRRAYCVTSLYDARATLYDSEQAALLAPRSIVAMAADAATARCTAAVSHSQTHATRGRRTPRRMSTPPPLHLGAGHLETNPLLDSSSLIRSCSRRA